MRFKDRLLQFFKLTGSQAMPSLEMYSDSSGTSAVDGDYITIYSPIDGYLTVRATSYNPEPEKTAKVRAISRAPGFEYGDQTGDMFGATAVRPNVTGTGNVDNTLPVQKGQEIWWYCTFDCQYRLVWVATKGSSK